MRIQIRFLGLHSSESLREYALRRIHLHMSRFGRELRGVVVRISDLNGPKGGVDKQCRITVQGPRVGSSTLDEVNGDVYAAVGSAVERVSRAVGRQLERARSLEHGDRSFRRRHTALDRHPALLSQS
jgi:hypothetical protein